MYRPNLCGQHKNSLYGSFFNSTVGGCFFLLSVFYGLVPAVIAVFYGVSDGNLNPAFAQGLYKFYTLPVANAPPFGFAKGNGFASVRSSDKKTTSS